MSGETTPAILQVTYIVSFFGTMFLLVAASAWWTIVRTPEKTEVAPGHSLLNSSRVRSGATATVIAFCLCGIAAILAFVAMFMRG